MAYKLKKVFLYAIPCICLMSHIIFSDNASAVTTTLDLSGYSIVNSANTLKINCRFATPVTDVTNVSLCNSSDITATVKYLRGIESVESWNFQQNDLIEFNLIVFSPVNLSSLDGFAIGAMPQQGGFRTIEFNQLSSGSFYNNPISVTNGTGGTLIEGTVFYSVYHIVMRYLNSPTAAYKIGMPLGISNYFAWSGDNLSFGMFNINQYRLTGESSSDQQNEINATNNSVQESESQGNTSQTDTDTATQSLMTAGANIISALTSAPATDCNINISTTGNSSVFTSAIGSLNLCSDVPSGVLTLVQGMVALVFTPIVLYYVYSILTLIYAQFKEYNS